MLRTLFMGTPDFAVETLKYIHKNTNLLAVFTKEDKINNRGNKITFLPVKQYAIDNNINILQPKTLRDEKVIKLIKELNPDLIIVVAYGMIIPKEIIDIPKYGIINVHSSLLPKYRGAAPIHYAILNGDIKTGVTIMYINEKLDEGDMICKRETEIYEDDNLGTLHDRLKILGKEAVDEALTLITDPNFKAEAQNHNEATYTKPIKKEETIIDFNKTSREIFNKIRGLNPFPEARCYLNDKILKIYSSKIVKYFGSEEPGTVIKLNKNGIKVKTLDGAIYLEEVKLEGEKKQKAIDFINGRKIKLNDKLR